MTKVSWMSYFMACCGGNQPPRSKTSDRQPGSPCRLSLSDFSSCSMSLDDLSLSLVGSSLHVFSITELQTVTSNFSRSNFIGEGGFGRVYKGSIDDKLRPGLEAQTVAVKRLELEGTQGHNEWLAEVIFLGQLQHQHQVKLIGYCYEGKHRLLVYEYMSRGSLENHLFRMHTTSLPWLTRLKIAVGAAKGLAFLHEAEKPVIYRDFKASNILLDSDYNAKLSDFGLAKDGPEGDDTHVSTRIMGTPGYAAPDYIMSGHLTAKSDVYSFGVVLLELLTGRRSIDKTRSHREQDLVQWARPYLKNPEKLGRIIDPSLDGQYSMKAAEKAALVAYQCLSQYPKYRPHMRTIIEMLEPLLDLDDVPVGPFVYIVLMEKETKDNEEKTQLASIESKRTSKQQKKMLDREQEIEHKQCGDRRKLRSIISVPHYDTTLYKNSTRQQKETWRERCR